MERRLTPEEVIDRFIDHPSAIEALRAWAWGYTSDKTLIDQLDYLLKFIDENPIEIEE
jgi:hypothetical protein